MSLGFELEPLPVHVAIEVDCQARHPSDGPRTSNEHGAHLGHYDRAGHTQVPIEPGMQQGAAIGFHAQECVPLGLGLELRAKTQVGRVRMRSDDDEPGIARRYEPGLYRNDAPRATSHVQSMTRLK